MKQWVLGLLLAMLVGLVGWGAWHGQTLLLQVYVIAATGIYGLARYLDDLPYAEWYAAASMFVAGGCIGTLAYYGEVGLLFAILWLAMVTWIEVKIGQALLGLLS